MGYNITPEEIEKMKAFLKEHPVDPQYEGLLDGNIPLDQVCTNLHITTEATGRITRITPNNSTTMHTHRGFFMPALYEGQAGCSQGIQTLGKPLV